MIEYDKDCTGSHLLTLIDMAKRVSVFVCMDGTGQYFPTTKKAAKNFAKRFIVDNALIPTLVRWDCEDGELEIG